MPGRWQGGVSSWLAAISQLTGDISYARQGHTHDQIFTRTNSSLFFTPLDVPPFSCSLLASLPSTANTLYTSETFLDLLRSKHIVACSEKPKDNREDVECSFRHGDVAQTLYKWQRLSEMSMRTPGSIFYICPRIRPIGDARVNWASPNQWHEWLCQWTRRFLFTVFALLTL